MNARDYLALLRERKLVIAASVLVCLLLAVAVTLVLPKRYESQVTFYVTASSGSSDNIASDNYQGVQLSTDRVKSYIELITGPRVAADAAAQLDDGTSASEVQDAVSASSVAETVVLTLTATASSPERAQDLAEAVTTSFTAVVDELESSQVDPATGDDAPAGSPVVTPRVVEAADLPDSPTSPSLLLDLVIGLAVGLLVGFGIAVARHASDTRLRSGRQLAEAAGAPVLGAVPQDRDAAVHPVALTAGPAAAARVEAYRRIRTALQVANATGDRRVLVVTSPRSGDGRTSTACNVAASLAAAGARVVLVDGDLRSPQVAAYLHVDETPGLTEVLAGGSRVSAAVLRWQPEQVTVLPAGAPDPRSAELLASRRTGEVLADLRARYDYVVVDSPPVLSVADAASLGAHADGVVLTARWGTTRGSDVRAAVDYLASVSVPVLGAVLTRVPRGRLEHEVAGGPAAPPVAARTPRPDPAEDGVDGASGAGVPEEDGVPPTAPGGPANGGKRPRRGGVQRRQSGPAD